MSLGEIIDSKNNNLSMKIDKQKVPEHVAIIMDGNGRWATKKGLPRTYGHKKGVSVLKEILKASKKLGWKPKITLEELVRDMIKNDMELSKKEYLLKNNGYKSFYPRE